MVDTPYTLFIYHQRNTKRAKRNKYGAIFFYIVLIENWHEGIKKKN
jgi:hypothetical protein